jgi:hypothetical protein
MNTLQEKTFYQLAGTSLPNASTAELFKLANEHPYFSAAQFFLTQKLQQENHVGFVPQLQKTALYFTNPYWLQYQLQQKAEEAIDIIYPNQTAETKPLLNRAIQEEIQQFTQPVAETVATTSAIEIPTMESVKDLMDTIQEPTTPAPTVTTEEVASIVSEPASQEEEPILAAPIVAKNSEEEQSIAEVAPQTTVQQHEEPQPATANEEEEAFITANPVLEQYETPSIDHSTNDMDSDAYISQEKLNTILSQQLEAFKKPVTETTELPIASEPYHTIDYFASQGIKVMADNMAHDKLSKQLRKFTDWLKHMKQVEVDPQDLGTDPELETAIHSIANTSNEAREIVTETMAEVLEKQGKTDKAIQLYIKLSFLNPDKSTYFASKIQKLKGI